MDFRKDGLLSGFLELESFLPQDVVRGGGSRDLTSLEVGMGTPLELPVELRYHFLRRLQT